VTARTLWQRKLRTGPEVKATLWFDPSVGEATLEIGVSACAAEDVVATELAKPHRLAKGGQPPR
jgi:hypothetical protein